MVINLFNHDDWNSITGTWSRNEWADAFTDVVGAWTNSHWGDWAANHARTDRNEVLSVAYEELLHAAEAWPAWAEEHDGGAESRTKAWAYIKTRINRRLMDFRKALDGRSESQHRGRDHVSLTGLFEERAGYEIRITPHGRELDKYEADRAIEPSTLHTDIVECIGTLTVEEQLVLALTTIDNFERREIAPLLGVTRFRVSEVYRAAASKVLAMSMNLVDEAQHAVPENVVVYPLPSGPVIRYIRETYKADIDTYLKRALAWYAADLRAVLELLTSAHTSSARAEATRRMRAEASA